MPEPINGTLDEVLDSLKNLSIYQRGAEIPAFQESQNKLLQAAQVRERSIDAFAFLPVPVLHNAVTHGVWVTQNMQMIIDNLGVELNPYESYLLSAVSSIHDADNIQNEAIGLKEFNLNFWRHVWEFRKKIVGPDESAEYAISQYYAFLPIDYINLLVADDAIVGLKRAEVKQDLHFLIKYHTVRQKDDIPQTTEKRGKYDARLDLLASILLFADSLQRNTYRINRDWMLRIKSEGLIDSVEVKEIGELNEFYQMSQEIIGNSPLDGGKLAADKQERYFELMQKFKSKDYAIANPNSAYVARLLMSAYMSAVKDVNLQVEGKEISLLVTPTADYERSDFMRAFIDDFASKVPEKADKANAVFARYNLPQIKMEGRRIAYTLVRP